MHFDQVAQGGAAMPAGGSGTSVPASALCCWGTITARRTALTRREQPPVSMVLVLRSTCPAYTFIELLTTDTGGAILTASQGNRGLGLSRAGEGGWARVKVDTMGDPQQPVKLF